MQGRLACEPFDGADFAAVYQCSQLQAGCDGLTIYNNGARSACTDAAAVFCAGQLQVFAQHINEQAISGLEIDLRGLAVQSKGDQHVGVVIPQIVYQVWLLMRTHYKSRSTSPSLRPGGRRK